VDFLFLNKTKCFCGKERRKQKKLCIYCGRTISYDVNVTQVGSGMEQVI